VTQTQHLYRNFGTFEAFYMLVEGKPLCDHPQAALHLGWHCSAVREDHLLWQKDALKQEGFKGKVEILKGYCPLACISEGGKTFR
jgi:hypothetical protein